MKTSMTKNEKIITWAMNKRTRSIRHMNAELNNVDERQLFNQLNRLVRRGWLVYKKEGQSVSMHLTRSAYYNRTLLMA